MRVQSGDFDPEAFEQAAAQLRPSWDDVPEPEMVPSQVPHSAILAPSANRQSPGFDSAALQGTGEEVDVARQVEVVVPRPPRTPRLDMSQLGTSDDDEFRSVSEMGIPTKSRRGLWVGVALAALAATLGIALVRAGHDNGAAPLDAARAAPSVVAPQAEAAPPALAVPIVPPAPAAPTEAAVAPAAPVAVEVAPTPAPEPKVEPFVAPPSPKAQVSAQSAGNAEKRAKSSPTRDSAGERRTSARTAPSKPKRGAGFVSANPY